MYNISQFFLFWARVFVFAGMGMLAACQSGDRFDVDVSASGIEIAVKRFDVELFSIPPDSLPAASMRLYAEHGTFYKLYVERVLRLGLVNDPVLGYQLKNFVSSRDIRQLQSDVQAQFRELTDVEEQLTDAFRRYHYFFPKRTVPKVYSFISGLEYQNIAADSLIMIGLDMYLGENYPYYQGKEFPLYKRVKMNRSHIVSDCVKNWLASEFYNDDDEKTLLGQMMFHGRILFAMDAVFPAMDDTLKIGYSARQLRWCRDNAAEMWAFFVEHKLFFSKDRQEIIKFIGEGPFTKGFPKDSPGETGKWLGWQIVRSYMANHPKQSLTDLMNIKDPQIIFHKSGYKP